MPTPKDRASSEGPLTRETITETITAPPPPPVTPEALKEKTQERLGLTPAASGVPPAPAPTGRYAVRVRTGHPTGVYRRAGIQFSGFSDVFMDEVPDAIRNDDWLTVKEVAK